MPALQFGTGGSDSVAGRRRGLMRNKAAGVQSRERERAGYVTVWRRFGAAIDMSSTRDPVETHKLRGAGISPVPLFPILTHGRAWFVRD